MLYKLAAMLRHFATAHSNQVGLPASQTRSSEFYILCQSELSRRKLSPTLAAAHYSSPGNAIGLVAQCELSGYVKLG